MHIRACTQRRNRYDRAEFSRDVKLISLPPGLCLGNENGEKSRLYPNLAQSYSRLALSQLLMTDLYLHVAFKLREALFRYPLYIHLSSFTTRETYRLRRKYILYLIVEFLASISREIAKYIVHYTRAQTKPLSSLSRDAVLPCSIQMICNYRCDSGKMIRDYLILLSWLCAVQGKIGKYIVLSLRGQ